MFLCMKMVENYAVILKDTQNFIFLTGTQNHLNYAFFNRVR